MSYYIWQVLDILPSAWLGSREDLGLQRMQASHTAHVHSDMVVDWSRSKNSDWECKACMHRATFVQRLVHVRVEVADSSVHPHISLGRV